MSTRNQFNFLVNGAQPTATGALNAIQLPDRVASAVTVQFAGTFTETFQFEGTVDGTNWIAIQATNMNTGTAVTTATAAGIFRSDTTGLTSFRLNVTAWTSSTSAVAMGNVVEG